jgi:mono/diheme cytochrome c family protein
VLALAAIAVVPPLFVARMRVTRSSSPRIHLWNDMDWQPKYKAQTASPLFSDGRSNRIPVAGTIASERLEDDDHFYRGEVEGEWATTFPQSIVNESMPETTLMSTMQRGQERFNVYCAVCHGLSGDGKGPVSLRAQQLLLKGQEVKWTPPTMLSVAQLLAKPVGDIFNTITNGKNTMPPYATQISAEDRWAIVMYVRALQRSRTATLDDVPEELRSKLP